MLDWKKRKRRQLTSPDSIDSTTRQAPCRSTMSHMALPRCNTTTSPGTRVWDDTALTHPAWTMGVRRQWFTRAITFIRCRRRVTIRETAAAAVRDNNMTGSQ